MMTLKILLYPAPPAPPVLLLAACYSCTQNLRKKPTLMFCALQAEHSKRSKRKAKKNRKYSKSVVRLTGKKTKLKYDFF
jgi:hypothetical protein